MFLFLVTGMCHMHAWCSTVRKKFARTGVYWSTPGVKTSDQPDEPDEVNGGDAVEGVGVDVWRRVVWWCLAIRILLWKRWTEKLAILHLQPKIVNKIMAIEYSGGTPLPPPWRENSSREKVTLVGILLETANNSHMKWTQTLVSNWQARGQSWYPRISDSLARTTFSENWPTRKSAG